MSDSNFWCVWGSCDVACFHTRTDTQHGHSTAQIHVQGHHEHLRRCLLVLNIAGTVVHHPSRTSDRWHHQNLHAFVSKLNVNANQSGTLTTRSTSDQTRQPPRQLATLSRLETDLGKTAGTCDELISAILMACPCAEYLCTGP